MNRQKFEVPITRRQRKLILEHSTPLRIAIKGLTLNVNVKQAEDELVDVIGGIASEAEPDDKEASEAAAELGRLLNTLSSFGTGA